MKGRNTTPQKSTPTKSPIKVSGNNSDWLLHFYCECNPFRTADKIKQIIKDNRSRFKKAIVYAKDDETARKIFNQDFGEIKTVNKVLIASIHTKQKVLERYFNFVLEEGKLLVTSLTPSQLFAQPGIIDVQDVNLIINEVLPIDPLTYLNRVERKGAGDKDRKGMVINLVQDSRIVGNIQAILHIGFNNYINIETVDFSVRNSSPRPQRKSPIVSNNNNSGKRDKQQKSPFRNTRPVIKNQQEEHQNFYAMQGRPKTPKKQQEEHQNFYAMQGRPKTPNKQIPPVSPSNRNNMYNTISTSEERYNKYEPNYNTRETRESPPRQPLRNSKKKETNMTNIRSTSPINRNIRNQTETPKNRNTGQKATFSSRSRRGGDAQKLKQIRQNVIGLNTTFTSGCLLEVEAVYVDNTATNRPYRKVEEMVNHAKLLAANPHTQFSYFGDYSTNLMKYARDSLLRSFNAKDDLYTVLPTGAGSTGAIQKTVLLLKGMAEEDENWRQPQIFVTPYEHHSNILPWVEFYDNIKVLEHNKYLTLDSKKIFNQIMECQARCVIVSISAASNVTSKLTHLDEINAIIKKVRLTKVKTVVFCVDCAAFCCHQQLDLAKFDQIDFAFLSPHKNLGGAESCGVLVARNALMNRLKPTFPGGGTVKFVKGYNRDDVMYETDNFSREIAGTPAYFGFYRAALSFELLTNEIGYDFIHEQEKFNTELFFNLVKEENNKLQNDDLNTKIEIYGDQKLTERANVVTFNIVYKEGSVLKTVHQNFVSLILTDVFGIQVRSGCFCAGPHGITLLDLTESNIISIEEEVQAGLTINKPGYVRIDLTFYLEAFEVEYIVNAITLIARYWKNYDKAYTMSKEGDIYLPSFIRKQRKQHIYSLSSLGLASNKYREQENNFNEKLRNRERTLLEQMERGTRISMNPVEYINSLKNK